MMTSFSLSAFRHLFALACLVVAPTVLTAQRFDFVVPGDDVVENVTSRANLLDAPAGKEGFVRVQDGQFVVGDKRIKFWGVNLCFSGNFPDHKNADVLAPHLAKLGVNAVRFHHMDSQSAPSGIWSAEFKDGKRQLDPEMVDRLDYLLARLHENGIYADINLHVSRQLTSEEGFPQLGPGAPWWASSNKWVMYYDASVQAKVKEYCEAMLTHQNPYRDGLARVDDPGIALVEMLNENYFSQQGYSLYRRLPERFQDSFTAAWNQWLVGRYGDTESMTKSWQQRTPEMGEHVIAMNSWNEDLGDWQVSKNPDELPRSLSVAGPSELDGKDRGIRFEPLQATEQNHHLQLRFKELSTQAGQPLTLTYWVRADEPRSYQVELSSSLGGEWRDVGLFEMLEAGPEWTKVTRIILPKETIENEVGFQFSFGSSAIPIEFAGVTLQRGGKGEPLPDSQKIEAGTVAIPVAESPVAAHEDMKQFMVETEIAWVEELKRFLQEDLGVKVPITASQINYHTPEVNNRLNDFIDLHNYWHHPMFPSGGDWNPERWTVGNDPMEADPTRSSWPANSLLMRTSWRIANKPFTLSEWNYPEPSPYSSGCIPMAAVLGALQDWDAVFFFDYEADAKDTEAWTRDYTKNFFSFNGQPVKLANFMAFANVFARGDLAPLEQLKLAPTDKPIDGTQAFQYRLATSHSVDESPSLSEVDPRNLSTPTGSLTWKSDGEREGHLKINTPKTQGVWGTIGGGRYETDGLTADVSELALDYGTLIATSQDNRPLEQSQKILLLATTHTENQDMSWNEDRTSVGRNWGNGPTTVVGIEAAIELTTTQDVKVYALDGRGNRTDEVPTQIADGIAKFQIHSSYETQWYEVSASQD
ncbi:hypothetical protein [Rubripirellula amarantea]|uniref:hypothetical protein n=1 Tax=Rubripirellula amarantea TaxID=2527999 RepID=UPI0011B38EF2|nr:hypothetical protein [Rubripirellula amarantea]